MQPTCQWALDQSKEDDIQIMRKCENIFIPLVLKEMQAELQGDAPHTHSGDCNR